MKGNKDHQQQHFFQHEAKPNKLKSSIAMPFRTTYTYGENNNPKQ